MSTGERGRTRIGCSGWQYKSWRGRFYPAALPTTRWLDYYTSVFDTVEINNTFYRLPETRVFRSWKARTPDDFLVAVKASRYLTHMTKLLRPAEPLRRLLSRAAALGSRLGPILYQLPADLRLDIPRLDTFLGALARVSRSIRARRPALQPFLHVLEFRHDSWYVPAIFERLSEQGVVFCLHDKAGSATPRVSVGPAVYIRFHGTSGNYHGEYDDRTLGRWAAWVREQQRDGRAVYAYFNNDPDAAAPRNAAVLRAFLAEP